MRKIVILTSVVVLNLCGEGFAADYKVPRNKRYDFPIYTNQPSGKQLSGVYSPSGSPALAPDETQKKFQVPPGFEVRLFAAEPDVVNPVAMTWDDRGRLWVLELYEYPKGAPKGEKGRDRIKILEDVDGDGRADKVTVFADGFSLATGLALGNGGVYLGAAPNFYFLQDTNGDDKADKVTVLKTGFGMEDRHELLNGFAWGPDGWLYMTEGVFTHSKVRDPNDPDDTGVRMDAALARYRPATKKFEVFADGTSNPWGVDWDERGEAFVSACVIQHLFHMAPGGQYNRQGGTWPNQYGYVNDLPSRGLPAVVDWRHYRAAHAGIDIYQGNQYPAEWRGLVFIGNIHQSALNLDRLTPVGSTYKAEKETTLLGPAGETLRKKTGETVSKGEDYKFVGPGNFLVSRDTWFRPVSNQTGPDGAMWVMDWYDKYPCYQNAQADPEGVDREHGRIWRVVWVGNQAGKPIPSRPEKQMNLAKLSDDKLIQLLGHPNVWQRRQAQRLLKERSNPELVEKVKDFFGKAASNEAARSAFWALMAMADLRTSGDIQTVQPSQRGNLLDIYADRGTSDAQIWMARTIGEQKDTSEKGISTLLQLARNKDPRVRAASASALRQLSAGELTIDSGDRPFRRTEALMPHFKELLARPSVDGDTYYPHIVWMAMEVAVAENPEPFFPLLAANENSASAYCTRRVMRRISDISDRPTREKYLNAALHFVSDIAPKTELAGAALDGLIEAQKSKGAPPTVELGPIFAKLTANPAIADKARRLATMLGDTSASKTLIAKINDPKSSIEDRLKGIQAAKETKDDGSRAELLKLVTTERNQPLLIEGVRALNAFTGDDIAYEVVDAWKNFPLPARRSAAEVLVTRSKWARALLAGVEKKVVDPQDISATARRALARADDKTIGDNADRLLGRYRASSEDKLKLIAQKKKMILSGTPDLQAGHEVAKRTCFVCHKLHGEGADVGPDLTGVGRSSLEALLHNVIDPNEVIGAGYETTEVELKDGSTVSGRVVEDSDTRIKLVAAGPTEQTIAKSDITVANGKMKIRKTDFSLMPEGLEQIPDDDFRNLIWYILNPPQDNRPWSPALRKELIGDEGERKNAKADTDSNVSFRGPGSQAGDGESVALWNPDWKVTCQPFEGAPKKLVEYAGRRNVLMTHPLSRTSPALLERDIEVPSGRKTTLSFAVASDERGDWELHVVADGKVLKKQLVNHEGERWKQVVVDLTSLAGKNVHLRLENASNDWNWEFAYWSELQINTTEQRASK
ncbi:MAG: rane-bound dehydrogenase domain protein [Verrucomicrobiales bacterium]|nr:rane-bound dehydrogenase domain protein [Verrucomicrobiales bacterium]